MRHTSSTIASPLVAMLVVAASAALVAAQEPILERGFPDDDTASTRLFNVPAAAFTGDGYAAAGNHFFSFAGYVRGAGGTGCIVAPAHLPDEGNAFQFFASLYDNDASSNLSIYWWRVDNYTGISNLLATISTTGASTSIQSLYDLSIPDGMTDFQLPTYSYYVTTCLPTADLRVYSARIWYRPDLVFADGFEGGTTGAWGTALH